MSHKEKKKTQLKHAEIAEELKGMAEDFAQGKLRIGRHPVAVGEPVFLKMKQKLEGDTAYFTLSVKMPVIPEAASAAPDEAPGKAQPDHPQTAGGYGGKKFKKEIGRLWKSISKQLEAEQMPDAAQSEGLLDRCEEYKLFVDAAWADDWTACMDRVQKCLANAAAGDWPAAKAMAAEVNRLTHECHQKYK